MAAEYEILGFLAATLTTGSALPQTIKTLRTKETHSISLAKYAMLLSGVTLWLTFGFINGIMSIIIANALNLAFNFPVLYMKIQNVRKGESI